MRNAYAFQETDGWFKYRPRTYSKVLLREPERCLECGRVYVSLYPLRHCGDHNALDEI